MWISRAIWRNRLLWNRTPPLGQRLQWLRQAPRGRRLDGSPGLSHSAKRARITFMRFAHRGWLAFVLALLAHFPATAQTERGAASAPLRQVRVEGEKHLTEEQVVSLTQLQIGARVARGDLQAAADRLVQTGLFSKVNYSFTTEGGEVVVTYTVADNPRFPVYFDNIPWFADSELSDAIRKKVPIYNGSLPAAGAVVDEATAAINELLTQHGLQVNLQHQLLGNPAGEGEVQEFRIQGASLRIAKIEFSDPALLENKAIRIRLSELQGKEFSRATIDLFLAEDVRPVYWQQGFLRAKLGPPQIRLSGNPNQKLPDEIPVYVPIAPGPVYHWQGALWSGNSLLSTITLDGVLGLKPGDVANGMQLEGAWDRIREQYGRMGHLDVKVEPVAKYDDQAHTVSYAVAIQEGPSYKLSKLILTGLSPNAEKRLREAFPFAPGDVFDKGKYENLLTKLEAHKESVFGDLPLHYETVGHWLQTDAANLTVDVLLDFK